MRNTRQQHKAKQQRKAVAYMRYSSSNQQELSIESQKMKIYQYCVENGIEIMHEYIDRAQTGTNDKRTEFKKMMNDAKEKPEWSEVLVYDSSRFSRKFSDAIFYENLLKDAGIKITSVTQNFDDSIEGRATSRMAMVMDAYTSEKISKTTHDAMLVHASKGCHCGGKPPLGYDVGKDKKLVINQTEAEAVKMIFDLYEQNYTRDQIAKKLNAAGYVNKLGAPFTKGSFSSILSQRKYTGLYFWNENKGKDSKLCRNSRAKKPLEEQVHVQNGCPQIISPEQFERVQEAMKTRKSLSVGTRHHYMLSGQKFMQCAECGAYMVGTSRTSHGRVYTTYACPNHKYNGCPTKEIRTEILNEIVAKQLSESLMNSSQWKNLVKGAEDTAELRSLRIQKRNVENIISNLLTTIEKCPSESLVERLAFQEEQKATLATQITTLEKKRPNLLEAREEVCAYFEQYIIDSDEPEVRRYLQQAVREIKVSNKEVKIKLETA